MGRDLLRYPNEVEITALCDKNPLRIKGSKALTGLKREEFYNHETLLQKADCDTVIVTTPDFTHEKVTIDSLQAGRLPVMMGEAAEKSAEEKRTIPLAA